MIIIRIRLIKHGEVIESIIDEAKYLTFIQKSEHALVTLANGDRALVQGDSGGIFFPHGSITRIFGHTHTRVTGASVGDYNTLLYLKQSKQYIFEGGRRYPIYNTSF